MTVPIARRCRRWPTAISSAARGTAVASRILKFAKRPSPAAPVSMPGPFPYWNASCAMDDSPCPSGNDPAAPGAATIVETRYASTMPLTWTISHFDKMIEAQAVGIIRFPDVIEFLDAARAEGALAYRKLFDARQADGKFNESDLATYAGAASGYGSVEPLGPIALLIGPRGVSQNEALFRRLTITQ